MEFNGFRRSRLSGSCEFDQVYSYLESGLENDVGTRLAALLQNCTKTRDDARPEMDHVLNEVSDLCEKIDNHLDLEGWLFRCMLVADYNNGLSPNEPCNNGNTDFDGEDARR